MNILNYVWTRSSDLAEKTRNVMGTSSILLFLLGPWYYTCSSTCLAWQSLSVALFGSYLYLFVDVAETCQAYGDGHIQFLKHVTSYLCCTINEWIFLCYFYFRQMQWIEQSIKNVVENTDNDEYFYVTEGDITKCYSEDQIIVLEAPLGAKLSVGNKHSKLKVHYDTFWNLYLCPLAQTWFELDPDLLASIRNFAMHVFLMRPAGMFILNHADKLHIGFNP